MEKVLVAGATGKTGYKVIQLLKESQYFEPIAMVRNEQQKIKFDAEQVKTVMADLEQDVSHSTEEIDKVVFAAGSGGKNVEAVDKEGAKKLIRASEHSKVKKFVMLSSMGADNPEQSDTLQDYLKAKQDADAFLKASNLNYTIVRPGALTDKPGAGSIELAKSVSKQGEISRDDVAQTLIRSLHDDAANKETFEIITGDTLIGKAFDGIS
ncbi:SDR family oxidoreductase [Bizionia arctica]|uniref:NAD dependent epimerase/dehydratase n=1 Tax=Bizionia arctica TaxID=1495645 RepID=A0A917GHG8_9FLAO|nr:SDR family oxidoreductase [Bizionia arctica]GGG46533.1 NAD dependent epimerase/dehydratase [Bizionia arctica]